MDKAFIDKIAEICEVKSQSIELDTPLSTLQNWDSMATVAFVVFVKTQYDINLSGMALRKANTVRDLWTNVQEKMEGAETGERKA